MSAIRFLQLSQSRQVLVRLCQTVNYGQIRDLSIGDREPILKCSPPAVFVDVRLDADEQPVSIEECKFAADSSGRG